MFENEVAVNQMQMNLLLKVAHDLEEDVWFQNFTGHGHSPVWLVGHLIVTGQSGKRLLGGTPAYAEWASSFSPGTKDDIAVDEKFARTRLISIVEETYRDLREMAQSADPERIAQPHGIAFFKDTPLKTVGHAVSLLLTSHFSFHTAQLSGCRRAQGLPALF